jgi:hypothetical protein
LSFISIFALLKTEILCTGKSRSHLVFSTVLNVPQSNAEPKTAANGEKLESLTSREILFINFMKSTNTTKLITLLAVVMFLAAGCGIHYVPSSNRTVNGTRVELTKGNFKVVKTVKGNSTATYVLGFGGISNKALIEKAKADMLENADMEGKARTIIDLVTEYHLTRVFPFYYQKTVTVSGTLIEFTD